MLTGTLTCSSDAMVYAATVATQTIRKTTVSSSSGVYVNCSPGQTYTWDLAGYAGGTEALRAGVVSVSTRATATDTWSHQDVTTTDAESFRLKRA